MPSTSPAVEPDSTARTFPRDQLAADARTATPASSIETARQAAAERPRHSAAGEAT